MALLFGVVLWQAGSGSTESVLTSRSPTPSAGLGVEKFKIAADSRSRPARRVLPLRIVDGANNTALPFTELRINYWGNPSFALSVSANAEGLAKIPVANRDFDYLNVWIAAKGYVPKMIKWHKAELSGQMEEYVVRLDRGRNLAGKIVDEEGEPIAAARLEPRGPGHIESEKENIGYHPIFSTIVTDEHGLWKFEQLPQGLHWFSFYVSHPDFARTTITFRAGIALLTNNLTALSRGFLFNGSILNTNGEPISGAEIRDESRDRDALSVNSDAAGEFAFDHVNPGELTLTVTAMGYQPVTRMFEIASNSPRERFTLAPSASSGEEPASLAAEQTVHLIARVIDADTQKPLERFKILRARSPVPELIGEGRAGKFEWQERAYSAGEFSVEVRAEGYRPELSSAIPLNVKDHTVEVALHRDPGYQGIVVMPNGEPAANAEVHLAGKGFRPFMARHPFRDDFLESNIGEGSFKTKTDNHGRFAFKPRLGANRVMVVHPTSCAVATIEELKTNSVILRPYGKVVGEYVGATASRALTIGIRPVSEALAIPYNKNVQTDREGKFIFERVPPGNYLIFRFTFLNGDREGKAGNSHYSAVNVNAAETSLARLGGGGRTIIGRIQIAKFLPHWTRDLQRIVTIKANALRPNSATALHQNFNDYPDFAAMETPWTASELREPKFYFAVKEDGTFAIDDVPPGNYRLELRFTSVPLFSFPQRVQQQEVAVLKKEFIVTEPSVGESETALDLGVLPVALKDSVSTAK